MLADTGHRAGVLDERAPTGTSQAPGWAWAGCGFWIL